MSDPEDGTEGENSECTFKFPFNCQHKDQWIDHGEIISEKEKEI